MIPRGLSGKESVCDAGDICLQEMLDSSVRKIPWRGAWQLTLNSCLENSKDRGAWWATVHRVSESDTTEATESSSSLFGV